MSNEHESIQDLAQTTDATTDDLALLHARLAGAAQSEGILDIAYRVVDGPVGP